MLASQQLVNFLSFLAIQQTRANNASLFIPFFLSLFRPRCSPPRQPATSDAADEQDRNNTTTPVARSTSTALPSEADTFPSAFLPLPAHRLRNSQRTLLFAAKSTSPAPADRSQHGSALCSPLADLLRTEASSVALGTHNFPLVI